MVYVWYLLHFGDNQHSLFLSEVSGEIGLHAIEEL